AASATRREYRHRDAGHVPPGAPWTALGCRRDREQKRPKRPALAPHPLDVISVPRIPGGPFGQDKSCGPRRGRATRLSTSSRPCQRNVSTSYAPVWTSGGEVPGPTAAGISRGSAAE